MDYANQAKIYAEKGIDWDLDACLENNGQDGFTINDIQKVLAVHEGDNEGPDWAWVLKLGSNKYAYLQGGCDYTGWDCQSFASHSIESTALKAAEHAKTEYPEAYESLKSQIKARKKKLTWHEETDEQMPDLPKI